MTRTITVCLADAFTTQPGRGNRAGVVLNASGLSDEAMQAVAALVGVSETAFLSPAPDGADFDLVQRYFTPEVEVPTCGHATIGSHFVRARTLGMTHGRVRIRTGAGVLPIDIETVDGALKVTMTQGAVTFTPPYGARTREAILAALGLGPDDPAEGLPVQEVSTGHSKVMVPIRSVAVLDRLEPDMAALRALSREIGCNGYFVFVLNDAGDDCLTSGRMFAPAVGIDEDPVTGNGNGPCGAYLSRYGVLPDRPVFGYLGRQGVAMGREGLIEVTVTRDEKGPYKVQVGGTAVEAGRMEIELSDNDGRLAAHIL
ncbi:phenazine biosynthesis protein PhzF family [Pseudodesulfovibrio mercurii]|uniref:Phenazine biosynthesis protein PhzF family n=1 Tax=Pseudodesulfovibrio mercurii TaxID=641491 RepID=F0JI81_9BACT|nr:PhzF family phenazine biosynthesis isomerase [Pseudodesulfovibrio mercurii]EGB15392.1 phenazine biosynthesis protein PhzF family [Pseudodesulfovibrio mercurii]